MSLSAACAAVWVCMSLLLFAMMGTDKRAARLHARRIPEKTLFLTAVFGGAAGGWLGMYVFRHKTRHWYFAAGFPLLAAGHAVIYFLLR